jgi:hypothetical protein
VNVVFKNQDCTPPRCVTGLQICCLINQSRLKLRVLEATVQIHALTISRSLNTGNELELQTPTPPPPKVILNDGYRRGYYIAVPLNVRSAIITTTSTLRLLLLLVLLLALKAAAVVVAATAWYKWFTKNEDSAYFKSISHENDTFQISDYAFNGMKKKQ